MNPILSLKKTSWVLVFFSWGVFFPVAGGGQTAQNQNPKDDLLAAVAGIEKMIEESDRKIQIEDFDSASRSTQQAISSLNKLADLFMPFKERVEKLIRQERQIESDINQLRSTQKPKIDADWQKIIQTQFETRNESRRSQKQISSQLSSPKTQDENQVKTLKEIEALLGKAVQSENETINALEQQKSLNALKKVAETIALLEEILEKMKKEQDPKNKQDPQDQKNQQKQQEQKDQKPSSNPDNADAQEKDDSQQKKMTPEEAVKELNRIKKQANDEKERREKKYGKIKIQGPIPVDRDW